MAAQKISATDALASIKRILKKAGQLDAPSGAGRATGAAKRKAKGRKPRAAAAA